MESVPVRAPATVGVKVTPITQELLGGSDAPQLPACAATWKAPTMTGALRDRAEAVSLFVTVTVSAALATFNGWLEKVRLSGATVGAFTCAPVPWSAILCGLPGESSVTVRLAKRSPDAVGVKITLKVQLLW
jgi:hypothetical protein